MANFEESLNARINEAEERAKLSDELYQKYVQFVGALEALPRNHFNDDWKSTDIHDIHGRLKPFSHWPTKSSREKSQKVWLNYNQRLQLQQAAQEAGLEGDEDPSEDPNFVSQMLDTCVRTSIRAGLDKQTAFRHCSRQVKKYEHAIRMAISDKGLPKKEMEEFVNELLKGMANGKQIDMKDMSIEDRQFIQDLKDSLSYKKPESGIKEDLDDKDTFRRECSYYNCDNRPDADEFHPAHLAAFENAKKAPPVGKFSDIVQREMAKFGYSLIHTGKPVMNGIPFDDRDYAIKENTEYGPPVGSPDSPFKTNIPAIAIHDLTLNVGDWIEVGPPPTAASAGEGLDDKDEFGRDDVPSTPVQIVGIKSLKRGSEFSVRLNNFGLLSQADKSGVRWHNRPKHHEPTWYTPWHGNWWDAALYEYYEKGELRKIDNIEQWFQSQPEK